MPASTSLIWEVRSTASDNNGGAFKAGAAGTDRSQQDAAQVAINNSTITCTTPAANSNTLTFTSGYTPSAADVGNVVQILTGTNINAGFYEITAQTATTWTLAGAANLTTAGGAGSAITGNMGGALATIGKLAGAMLASNKAFVKATATYTTTATITFAQSAGDPTTGVTPTRVEGYTTTRGDGGRATLQLQTNTNLTGLNGTGTGIWFSNFIVDCNSLSGSTGIAISFSSLVSNCKVINFQSRGFNGTGGFSAFYDCEASGGSGFASGGFSNAGSPMVYVRCWSHNNAAGPGFNLVRCTAFYCLATNNAAEGFLIASGDGTGPILVNCLSHGNGSHGINIANNQYRTIAILGCLLTSNTGYGLVFAAAAGDAASVMMDGNAYWNNTSGTRQNIDDGTVTTTYPQNAVAPYTSSRDVSLTGNPYTNAATNDFTLNNTAGAGAAARAHGPFNSFTGAGLSVAGFGDMGPLQHQEAAAGGVTKLAGFGGGLVG
jgi:hypothetical protein